MNATPPAPDTRRALLEARGLRVTLDGRAVLGPLDLSLGAGELLAVAGPNGAGKSTLLRALAGVLDPCAGELSVAGRALGAYRRRDLARQLAYLPQECSTPFALTVEELVRQGRYASMGPWGVRRASDRSAVESALERADVAELRGRSLPQLSGGERRRAFLGRAIAQDAPILLLDEPTTALDVGHACEVLHLLSELAAAGKAVLFTLHDVSLAARLGAEVMLLDQGVIRAKGEAVTVLTSPEAEKAFGVRLDAVGDPPAIVPGL